MLAKLRRTHALPPPQIHEPPPAPPPASARREKEGRWLRSIGRAGGKAAGSTAHEDAAAGAGDGLDGVRASAPSVRSARSSGSFRRLFGSDGAGSRSASRDARDGARLRDADRAGAEGAGSLAPPSSTASRGRRGDRSARQAPHPSSSSSSSFASADARPGGQDKPVSLAQRLQELAVANADGLLDEDEYRILRGQLFEASVAVGQGGAGAAATGPTSSTPNLGEGLLAVPSLRRIENEARRASTTSTILRPDLDDPPRSPASVPPASLVPPTTSSTRRLSLAPDSQRAPSLAQSTHSKRTSGLRGLFRRPSAASVRAVEPLGEGWTHVAPVALSASGSSPVLDNHASVQSAGQARRSRAPVDLPPGGYSTNRTRSIGHHPGLASSAFSSASSPRLRRDKLPPSSLAASTTTRSHASTSTSAHYASTPLPPLPSARDPAALVTRDLSALELQRELDEIEGEWGRVRRAWDAMARDEVRRWEDEVGVEVVRGLSGRALVSADGTTGLGGDTAARRRPAAPLSLSPNSSSPASSTLLELPSFLLPSSPSLIPPGLPDDIDLATRAVQRRVRELYNRQAATDDKYSRRLDFLRARLRAAEIRERLR
ncbi:uncharacterized protein RHOBADRAFT_45973 [Rhodotorula graminis WP1]|uniref:Uncharacterized protein n=1 Tax=Rhodotorula graminis (strain WP1) TaxID=578459 RepID=A0A0P9EN63_RHOGW|nr:uncharacterized protein RHOBADRAFT_45973 [Rhodotorula graminis WP1]KPV73396.1 hypothetical protein RHOBADRAFT_45973 [Rhodotorula graminis WP1]